MYGCTRKFIQALGGYREVARRLGKSATTVHTHMQSGVLPASWWGVLTDLALAAGSPPPERELFSFIAAAAPETPEGDAA